MHVPTVCLINLSASPIPASSSALSAAACAGGMVWLWRRTLFFRMRPAAMRIATGRSVSRMKTCATVWLNSGTVCSWSSCAFTAACTAESGTCACSSMVTTCPTAVASGCHAILSPAAAAAPDTRSTRVSAPAGLSRRLSGPLLTVSRPYSASAHPPGRRDPARAWARPPQLGRPFHGASGGHRHLCERTTVIRVDRSARRSGSRINIAPTQVASRQGHFLYNERGGQLHFDRLDQVPRLREELRAAVLCALPSGAQRHRYLARGHAGAASVRDVAIVGGV
jgi:hypothetical protein